MNIDPLNLDLEKETLPVEERILEVFKKSSAFWCCNTIFQLIFIPILVALFIQGKKEIGLPLLSMLAIPMLISIGQRVFHKKITHPLLDEYGAKVEGGEKFVANIKKLLLINSLCWIPFFGVFTAFVASKVYCMLDVFRHKSESLMNDWIQNCKRCFRSFLVAHAGSIISTNVCWVLLAFHSNSNVLFSFFIFLGFSIAWGVVSGIINCTFVKHNTDMSYKVRKDGGIDGEIFNQMEVWRKSITSNFIVYIPLLGVFAMIPFFISREILSDMEISEGKHNRQYVRKCKIFMHILIWGSLMSLPYIICISVLGKWKENPWLAIPLCFNLITSTAINFWLSCEQDVYSQMYLSESKNYEDIKTLNFISKLCSGLIIFTFFPALPSIIIFMKKLREFRKKEGITYDNKIMKLVTKK